MITAPLDQAIVAARSVLEQITGADLARATPCRSWTVAAVIDHVISGQHLFAAMAVGDAPVRKPIAVTAVNHRELFEESVAAGVAAFRSPEAQDVTVTLPFGQMSIEAFVKIAATDLLTHTWDIARATGQHTDLDPQLAEALLANAHTFVSNDFRGPDGVAFFAVEQSVPDDAPAADRLAAFLGRSL